MKTEIVNSKPVAASVPRRSGFVLIVDDEEQNRMLLRDPLEARGYEIAEAENGQQALQRVAERLPDVVLLDVMMSGMDGFEVCRRLKNDPKTAPIPVLMVTALSERKERIMGIAAGANDFLNKPVDLQDLTLRVRNAVSIRQLYVQLQNEASCRLNNLDQLVTQRTTELQSANERLKKEIAQRMQTEKALRLSEKRFSKAFRATPIPLAIQSLREENFVDANEGFQKLTGFSREELIGRTPDELNLWSDPGAGKAVLNKLHQEMSVRNLSCRLRSKSTQTHDILLSVELFELDGEPFLLTIAEDITEQIKLENRLCQAQKMQAVGQLAAGVAHDFNNILTVVQGHVSLLLAAKPAESPDRRPLQTIAAAAERASKLVRQLLTFSRKQFVQLRPMNIRDVLSTVAEILPRVLGEHIAVEVSAAADLPLINADAGMIEQMLMNLVVNAGEAMAGGGHLTLSLQAVQVTSEAARENLEARPGKFICLSVLDTGCGIAPEILPRIFEPFFTTKPMGKGTGLGLATVYGIAKQHEGWIEVQSQLGQGTTFHVFLPTCDKKTEASPARPLPQRSQGGKETLLVAEDEKEVRQTHVGICRFDFSQSR